MRKLFSLLVVLCLLIASPAALADKDLPYPAYTALSVVDLTPSQLSLSDYLYPYIMAGEKKINLPSGTLYNDVSVVMSHLTQDYPELFHLARQWRTGYYSSEPDIATYVQPEYRVDQETAENWRSQLYAQAKELISRFEGPYQLHDALCNRVTYGGPDVTRHTAVGALLYDEVTCEGYAQALALLYRMAGIPCGVVYGEATNNDGRTEGHAWNIADINGYTLVDATWNDQDSSAFISHNYMGVSSAQLGVSHVIDEGQTLPLCTDRGNWHRKNGLYVTSIDQVYAIMRSIVHTGGAVSMRFGDANLYHWVTGDLSAFRQGYNDAMPKADACRTPFTFYTTDGQLCLTIRVEAP